MTQEAFQPVRLYYSIPDRSLVTERLRGLKCMGKDVLMVEDFPLAPEEETPEFRDLATALRFRFVRAVEHWKGNPDLTLAQIIVRTVEDGIRRGAIDPTVSERAASRKDR